MSISLLSNDRTRRDSERDTLGGCSLNSETREYLDPFGPTRVGSLFNYQEKDNCSTEKCDDGPYCDRSPPPYYCAGGLRSQ